MDKKQDIRLVVGLGNPGAEYESTYHNAGALALDFMAGKLAPEGEWKSPRGGGFSYLKTADLILVRPESFMNESGFPVRKALTYFKIKPEHLLLIHDDSDLELGSLKIAFGQRSAGHHGVDSVIRELGTQEFWRARIGIRTARGKAGSFVLKPLRAEHKEILYGVLTALTEKVMVNDLP